MEAGFIPAEVGTTAPPVGKSAPVLVAPSASVVRAPGLKRGRMEEAITDRIKLETVLGLTVSSNAALDCDPHTEIVAYPAGCTVVLYNVRKGSQTHIVNASRKSVTCVAFSHDGRYLVTGECGHAPAVRVWDLQDPTASGAVQIAEFSGHTHGVGCVAFSKSSKYLVSVGSQHDMIVNVWDWRANLKLASNKVSARVKAVSFSESGNYFVTVGFRHVKFWYLEYSRNSKIKEPVPLMGRSAILGEQIDNEFCDVVCGRGAAADSTYAITRGGLLCEFNSRRLLDKWVELRTTSANCLAIGSNLIFVGCAEGIVRCFLPDSLGYVTTLPRTHYLGVDVAQGADINHMFTQPPNARYPDAVALTYDDINHKLTCVYNDHSLYVWDVRDIKRVGKSHSALYHSACIWGVDMIPNGDTGTLLTCGSDDTVRLWHPRGPASNVYTRELQKILYIDPELKFLKDVDLTATSDRDKSKSYDDKTGVRCVRVSPDGQHIASGDRAGNVWIHTYSGKLLHTLEAHDAEVLCLEYAAKPKLLASASRDRLIHVFAVESGYQILQTLDEHSSSITAVRFLSSSGGLQMVSCGADKTILFRHLRPTGDGSYQFARGQNVSGRTTLYDMEVDAGGRHILTACQDRNVRVYSSANGRHTKTFRGTTAEDGTLIKVALDNSGIYLATSSTDKILSVYDYYSGECMASMYGHSEIVTGLRFTPDCQHLISASGDGCIFIWRVPHDMVVTMRARLAQQAIRQGKRASVPPSYGGGGAVDSEGDSHTGSPPPPLTAPDYTLRIGRLPSWAQKSLGDEVPPVEPPSPAIPRGKWATRVQSATDKRVDSDGSKDSSLDSGTDTRYFDRRRDQTNKQRPKSLNLSQLPRVEALFRNFDKKMKQTYDILTISPRLEKVTIKLNNNRSAETRTRHHTDDSSLGSFKYEDQESTEHDGDVEDISDGERTSSSESRNRPTYYPGNKDDETPSEFMVNAIDAVELRQSMRRAKRRPKSPTVPSTVASLSGSPRDSDDDEVSTPSADNADRNPLSGSCESLDTAGRRESYLMSAFDSLSGADTHQSQATTNNSLTQQHLRGPAPRPSPAPRAPGKHVDPDAQRRRDELNRRILETRRQLESVASRSNLKSSQSTTDLSYHPDKDRRRPVSLAVPSNSRPYGPEENLDSLNSNYFDSLNYQLELDYKNKNPYAIPANLNHRLPGYIENSDYIPPHGNLNTSQIHKTNVNYNYTPISNIKPLVFKQTQKSQTPLAFTVDFGPKKQIQSKVFDRLFPAPEKKGNNDTKTPSRNLHLDLTKNVSEKPVISKPKPSVRSIFKNYKSCPVSPVSEECKWADKAQTNQNIDGGRNDRSKAISTDPKKRNSLSFFVGLDNNSKNIVDTIKSDTEKMIAEITEKYGDLDEYELEELDYKPTRDVPEKDHGNYIPTRDLPFGKDDGNFSSDSLEDCSLSQDLSCKNKLYSKKICEKHMKTKSMPRKAVSNYEISAYDKPTVPIKPPYITGPKSSTLPRNMPSNFDDILNDDYSSNPDYNMHRCQSVLTKRCITRSNESVLSDNSNDSSVSNEIFVRYGNEPGFQQAKYDSRYNVDSQNCSFENINQPERYLENHRHSSASFFLNQKKYTKSCSQESILSDDVYEQENIYRTNCNSLESVLSDDSEYTKSAPLEMLFEGAKVKKGMPRSSKSCYEFDNQSKSYGSSPNNAPSFAGMYNNYLTDGFSPKTSYRDLPPSISPKPPSSRVCGFEIPTVEVHKTVTRSRSLYDSLKPPPKNVAYYFDGNNVQAYSKDVQEYSKVVQAYSKEKKMTDEIPRLDKTNMASASKSLQPKFMDNQKYVSEMEGCERNSMVKSKSCSFEVVLEPASKPNPLKNLMEKRNSHVQKNLEKFEEQIKKNSQSKVIKNHLNINKNGNTIATKSLERSSGQKINNSKATMEFVPHKPPKPIKRTSSAKINNRLKAGEKKTENTSTSISSHYKAKLDGLHNKNYNKRREDKNSNIQNDEPNMDSAEKTFDVFIKEKDINENRSEIQMDSLEVIASQRMERMKGVSLDSLDVIDSHDFAQDSLDFYAKQNVKYEKHKKEQTNKTICLSKDDREIPRHSRDNTSAPLDIKEEEGRTRECTCAPTQTLVHYNTDSTDFVSDITEEVKKYKYLERKIEIINKLVEMEEKKMLQEKKLKEWRMRPLKANLNEGPGVVKVLSRKFEKLATKQMTVPNFASLTLEEVETCDQNKENKEIKRNLSLPDILDMDKMTELMTENIETDFNQTDNALGDTKEEAEQTNLNIKQSDNLQELLNNRKQHIENLDMKEKKVYNTKNVIGITDIIDQEPNLNNKKQNERHLPKSLTTRLHNEMIIPKTDVHLDSENYESSTTSSSCTNSPKRLTIYGFHRPKIPLRKMIRVPTPRLCMERLPRPGFSEGFARGAVFSGGFARGSLAKKVSLTTPVLPSKFAAVQARTNLSPSDAEEDQSGMRRAISLSDLAARPMPAPRTSPGPQKQPSPQNGNTKSPSGFTRPLPRYNAKSNMTRSSSVGVLNQSDSESDAVSRGRPVSGLMRPTISSSNKQAMHRRRGLNNAYSAMSLSTGNQEESSSEAEDREPRPLEKPAVPPRPRAGSAEHNRRMVGRSGSQQDLSAKAREVTARLASNSRPRVKTDSSVDLNLSSSELCSALTDQLTKTASKVVQLYRSLQREPNSAADISGLEAAILETQKVLRSAVTRQQNGDAALSSLSSDGDRIADIDSTRQRLEYLVSKESNANNPAMSVIEQYSDILLNMMQSTMVNQFSQPQSLPPNIKREPGSDSPNIKLEPGGDS